MDQWQVQEAKARLSDLIEQARTRGPQVITWHGRERAVVVSTEDYRAMVAHQPDFKAHLLGGPKLRSFHVPRSKDTGRVVNL